MGGCGGWVGGGEVDMEVEDGRKWWWKWGGKYSFWSVWGMEGRRAGGSGVDGGVEWEVDEDEEVTRLSAIFRRFSDSIHSC